MEQILDASLWAANTGVIESLHQDPYDCIISMITGSQRVTLIPSWRYRELHPKIGSGDELRASQVCFPQLFCNQMPNGC
jgi:hypothetical protein